MEVLLMRRFAVIGLTVALGLSAAACGSSDKPESSGATTTTTAADNGPCGDTPTPAEAADFEPVKADTLSVVTSLPGPGFWEGSDTDPTKLDSGYEYDIAKCLQQMFGLADFNVRNVSFDAIVAGTATNYDLALTQSSITPERAKVVSFSEPYFESQQGILTRADDSITTLDEAKQANWGVQSGTTAIQLLKTIGVDNPHSYPDLSNAYTALQAGQVDAVMIDTAINLGEAARSNGKFHVTAQFEQPGGPDEYGAIFPKDSANVAPVNAVFKAMKDSGQLSQLVTKDLTADPGTIPVIQVPSS
jgi:polar amino acid transport system substrate-binding protein